jgi:CheY-specific phosphatase CheX
MRAQLNQECIVKANNQFWLEMLAMKLDTMPAAEQSCVSGGHLLGSVALTGRWRGSIEIRMAGTLAYEATAAMMMQPVETVAEADALDATKEIANMIAGLIKSSLPRGCSMTVPESAVEPEGFCDLTETANMLVVAFRHAAGDLMVRVREEECLWLEGDCAA